MWYNIRDWRLLYTDLENLITENEEYEIAK
jgi:hypothetical protein